MIDIHGWLTVAVIAAVTALIRFLPFAVWSGSRKTPDIINRLGIVLPYAIMGMLVVYCLKGVSFGEASGCLPELVSCLIVGITYVWRRNTLVSIVCGTVCYMLLVQTVFG